MISVSTLRMFGRIMTIIAIIFAVTGTLIPIINLAFPDIVTQQITFMIILGGLITSVTAALALTGATAYERKLNPGKITPKSTREFIAQVLGSIGLIVHTSPLDLFAIVFYIPAAILYFS